MKMVVRQLRVGNDNFSYLIHDPETHLAALVDPGFDASGALRTVKEEGLELKYVINTHHHLDHTASNGRVIRETGARLVASNKDGPDLKDGIEVGDRDQLYLGRTRMRFLNSPGHTPDGLCMITEERYLITGDTLFINDCGRCDLPGGSLKDMFDTLQRLKRLDDCLIVFPGHDLGPIPCDTLGNQKRTSGVLLAKDQDELSRL